MTNDAVSVVEFLFSKIWSFFICFNVPGTNVTPAAFAVFLLAASFGLRFFLSWSKSLPSSADAVKASKGAGKAINSYKASKK